MIENGLNTVGGRKLRHQSMNTALEIINIYIDYLQKSKRTSLSSVCIWHHCHNIMCHLVERQVKTVYHSRSFFRSIEHAFSRLCWGLVRTLLLSCLHKKLMLLVGALLEWNLMKCIAQSYILKAAHFASQDGHIILGQ